jgi:NCS1 family nucleobase:cation symporter-1
VLGEIWANYFDVYTAGLVALAMDIPLRRWLSALICGVVAAIIVYWIGLVSHFTQAQTYSDLVTTFLGGYVNFLLLTYLWVPAWAAVVLLDFFIFRKGRYQAEQLTRGRTGAYWYLGGLRWQAMVAWLLGLAAAIPFVDATLYQGPMARLLGGADISGLVGAIVAGIIYYALARLTLARVPDGAGASATPAIESDD